VNDFSYTAYLQENQAAAGVLSNSLDVGQKN
jgi:hypothetical protein